jgi:hypothetical protein
MCLAGWLNIHTADQRRQISARQTTSRVVPLEAIVSKNLALSVESCIATFESTERSTD